MKPVFFTYLLWILKFPEVDISNKFIKLNRKLISETSWRHNLCLTAPSISIHIDKRYAETVLKLDFSML